MNIKKMIFAGFVLGLACSGVWAMEEKEQPKEVELKEITRQNQLHDEKIKNFFSIAKEALKTASKTVEEMKRKNQVVIHDNIRFYSVLFFLGCGIGTGFLVRKMFKGPSIANVFLTAGGLACAGLGAVFAKKANDEYYKGMTLDPLTVEVGQAVVTMTNYDLWQPIDNVIKSLQNINLETKTNVSTNEKSKKPDGEEKRRNEQKKLLLGHVIQLTQELHDKLKIRPLFGFRLVKRDPAWLVQKEYGETLKKLHAFEGEKFIGKGKVFKDDNEYKTYKDDPRSAGLYNVLPAPTSLTLEDEKQDLDKKEKKLTDFANDLPKLPEQQPLQKLTDEQVKLEVEKTDGEIKSLITCKTMAEFERKKKGIEESLKNFDQKTQNDLRYKYSIARNEANRYIPFAEKKDKLCKELDQLSQLGEYEKLVERREQLISDICKCKQYYQNDELQQYNKLQQDLWSDFSKERQYSFSVKENIEMEILVFEKTYRTSYSYKNNDDKRSKIAKTIGESPLSQEEKDILYRHLNAARENVEKRCKVFIEKREELKKSIDKFKNDSLTDMRSLDYKKKDITTKITDAKKELSKKDLPENEFDDLLARVDGIYNEQKEKLEKKKK
jgi:hypothetical protein